MDELIALKKHWFSCEDIFLFWTAKVSFVQSASKNLKTRSTFRQRKLSQIFLTWLSYDSIPIQFNSTTMRFQLRNPFTRIIMFNSQKRKKAIFSSERRWTHKLHVAPHSVVFLQIACHRLSKASNFAIDFEWKVKIVGEIQKLSNAERDRWIELEIDAIVKR